MLVQPFVNYNVPGGDGWYLTTSPIITANWNSSGEKWVVPVGGGVGRLFKVGKLPINIQLSVYDNVITPKNGARWQTRFQIQFLLGRPSKREKGIKHEFHKGSISRNCSISGNFGRWLRAAVSNAKSGKVRNCRKVHGPGAEGLPEPRGAGRRKKSNFCI
jgi:hypothetical protein